LAGSLQLSAGQPVAPLNAGDPNRYAERLATYIDIFSP
jgi:hypothetical protein